MKKFNFAPLAIAFTALVVVLAALALTAPTPVAYTYTLTAGKVLGIVLDQNNVVTHVEPSSAAEASGILVGDEIEDIDGVKLMDKTVDKDGFISDPAKEKFREKDGKEVKIKIKRNGKQQEILTQAGEWRAAPGGTPTPVMPPNNYL